LADVIVTVSVPELVVTLGYGTTFPKVGIFP
jgi:hypothetical protein